MANNAKACPKCGHRFTSVFVKIVAGFFGISALFIILIVSVGSTSNTPQPTAAPSGSAPVARTSSAPHPITEIERNYFGAAVSYLQTANAQGTKLARTMAGASDGSSTLGDIKKALSSAKFIENAGYIGDYQNRINGNVPESAAKLSRDIDEVHRLFQSGIEETLEYWKDQNTAHIESGTATIKRSVILMNAAINEGTTTMREFKKAALKSQKK